LYKIRKARHGEEEQILALVKEVLSAYDLSIDPEVTDKDISNLEVYYFNNQGWFAVIEDNSVIIGSYGIFKINESTCELRKMYLLSRHQGHGLGQKMMEDAFAQARQLGYKEMILETNTLLTKAIALYKKYGFRKIQHDHMSDRCDLAMSRKL